MIKIVHDYLLFFGSNHVYTGKDTTILIICTRPYSVNEINPPKFCCISFLKDFRVLYSGLVYIAHKLINRYHKIKPIQTFKHEKEKTGSNSSFISCSCSSSSSSYVLVVIVRSLQNDERASSVYHDTAWGMILYLIFLLHTTPATRTHWNKTEMRYSNS